MINNLLFYKYTHYNLYFFRVLMLYLTKTNKQKTYQMPYTIKFLTKWSDFDANRHMRHTAYNDYAAEARLRYFKNKGFDLENFQKHNLGPVLFSENTIFRKEIKIGADIQVKSFLAAISKNGERCKIYHQILDEKGNLSAEITVYLAWIDLTKRKLTIPPQEIKDLLLDLGKTENFETIELKK